MFYKCTTSLFYRVCSCYVLAVNRRTTPAAQRDDDAFPIRVKLRVPPEGIGRLANDIPAWLNSNLAPGTFATHSARAIGGSAMAVYFMRIEDAQRFLEVFSNAELAIAAALEAACTGS